VPNHGRRTLMASATEGGNADESPHAISHCRIITAKMRFPIAAFKAARSIPLASKARANS